MALSLRGDAEGREMLERSLVLAREAALEEHVIWVLTHLAWSALRRRDYAAGLRYLDSGLRGASEHGWELARGYQLACRAQIELELGQWEEATDTAALVLREPRRSRVPRIVALCVTCTYPCPPWRSRGRTVAGRGCLARRARVGAAGRGARRGRPRGDALAERRERGGGTGDREGARAGRAPTGRLVDVAASRVAQARGDRRSGPGGPRDGIRTRPSSPAIGAEPPPSGGNSDAHMKRRSHSEKQTI